MNLEYVYNVMLRDGDKWDIDVFHTVSGLCNNIEDLQAKIDDAMSLERLTFLDYLPLFNTNNVLEILLFYRDLKISLQHESGRKRKTPEEALPEVVVK